MLNTEINTGKNYIIVFFLFSFLFWNCKKTSRDDRSDGTIQLRLSTEGLAYAQLGLGKYFIYKDSANGHLDSVVVTKSSLENTFSPAVVANGLTYPAYNSEVFSLTLTKFDAGVQTVWGTDFKGQVAPCCPSVSMDNLPFDIHDTSGLLSFRYPECTCGLSKAISSMTVDGKVYDNVYQVIGENGISPSSPGFVKVVTYWAKGVGIIKRTRTTGSAIQTQFLFRHN